MGGFAAPTRTLGAGTSLLVLGPAEVEGELRGAEPSPASQMAVHQNLPAASPAPGSGGRKEPEAGEVRLARRGEDVVLECLGEGRVGWPSSRSRSDRSPRPRRSRRRCPHPPHRGPPSGRRPSPGFSSTTPIPGFCQVGQGLDALRVALGHDDLELFLAKTWTVGVAMSPASSSLAMLAVSALAKTSAGAPCVICATRVKCSPSLSATASPRVLRLERSTWSPCRRPRPAA
jgi:hypothetical protein